MLSVVKKGDVVLSVKGRDNGGYYLVVSTDGLKAKIVNGKSRKVLNPKTKNVKHLKVIYPNALNALAEEINDGKPVGNERLWKCISAVKEKI